LPAKLAEPPIVVPLQERKIALLPDMILHLVIAGRLPHDFPKERLSRAPDIFIKDS